MPAMLRRHDLAACSPCHAPQADNDAAIVSTTLKGIEAVAEELLKAAPGAKLLLLGLLPRGEYRRGKIEIIFDQPNRSATSALLHGACNTVPYSCKLRSSASAPSDMTR